MRSNRFVALISRYCSIRRKSLKTDPPVSTRIGSSETDDSESESLESSTTSDDRSSFARAYDQASQVFSACLIMVLPSLGGYFLDQRLDTKLVFTLSGLLFGFIMGFVQLVKLTNSKPESK